ncbi:uncharacterized protein MONOS_17752 [Monocercomonoides exilis]|uniref:uncharacterized protein n=1 Tax=Monocercomonoides exilis TaxID=2049356 RepID=UPI00355A408C|nr:hypothetical protein MONOS_17752 [Monocercomonoides exilis]
MMQNDILFKMQRGRSTVNEKNLPSVVNEKEISDGFVGVVLRHILIYFDTKMHSKNNLTNDHNYLNNVEAFNVNQWGSVLKLNINSHSLHTPFNNSLLTKEDNQTISRNFNKIIRAQLGLSVTDAPLADWESDLLLLSRIRYLHEFCVNALSIVKSQEPFFQDRADYLALRKRLLPLGISYLNKGIALASFSEDQPTNNRIFDALEAFTQSALIFERLTNDESASPRTPAPSDHLFALYAPLLIPIVFAPIARFISVLKQKLDSKKKQQKNVSSSIHVEHQSECIKANKEK